MSSSPTTATGSRSPSPATPESSDNLEPIAINPSMDTWYHHLRPGQSLLENTWETDVSHYLDIAKNNEEPMLHIDDLIERNAYDESPCSDLNPTLAYPSPPQMSRESPATYPSHISPQSISTSNLLVQSQAPMSITKPIPPPASRPHKRDPSAASQTVVYPPKESCYNLPIMIPSIPEGGTKSRVETQVRVTVDLAHASSSGEPFKYDRVGSWKWLKLPPGTATKKRTRKEGKIDPAPHDILHLAASVTCASPPHNRVLSCTSCQARETKRVARKLAARVRPARSDSDSPEDTNGASRKVKQEDTTSIVQFNCAEVLEFSTGSVVLPLRITCYCRHHREKVGFHVHFTMMDHAGRVVGTGTTRPIMITDDHKSTGNSNKGGGALSAGNLSPGADFDWSQANSLGDGLDTRAPSKRKNAKPPNGQSKRRTKPYDTGRKSGKVSRENSVTSFPSPSTSPSTLPVTRSPSPTTYGLAPSTLSQITEILTSLNGSATVPPQESESSSIAPSDMAIPVAIPAPPSNSLSSLLERSDVLMHGSQPDLGSAAVTSPEALGISVPLPMESQHMSGLLPTNMPYMFFNPPSPLTMPSLPPPKIHRLIPNTGPTIGGIEVTVLGANFHPSVQLNCVFGDSVASSTQRWSDNTLLCLLPPRATPGVVGVWFDGMEKEGDGSSTSLFTYTDESDRALMELALQVVGLKMTGKIEDAKNVALRIVGTPSGDDSSNNRDMSSMMQLASSALSRDIGPLLLRTGNDNFENRIIKFLSVLDVPVDDICSSSITVSWAISRTTLTGQTLLHLATFLGFSALAEFLINREIDLDARDRNGCTALHFAAIAQSKDCARLLLQAGADMEVVNSLGKTPEELAPPAFFDCIVSDGGGDVGAEDEDDESRWGDAEGETEDESITVKRTARRRGAWAACDEPVSEGGPAAAVGSPLKPKLVDDKQTASFVEMIQRTLAQLYAPQGIIPNMSQLPLPQLPLPNLPHLPGMPAVPWGVLPQIPMVFPVFVPMSVWPSFLGDKRGGAPPHKTPGEESHSMGAGAIRTAQEWRTMCEKWMVALAAAATRQQADEAPPPMYTPRAPEDEHKPPQPDADSSRDTHRTWASPERRRFDYDMAPVPDQEVNAYAYRPTQAKTRKRQKKHDRMLILFWIPILLISLVWGFVMGLQSAFHALRTALPLQSLLR